jgi:hypothetical protein
VLVCSRSRAALALLLAAALQPAARAQTVERAGSLAPPAAPRAGAPRAVSTIAALPIDFEGAPAPELPATVSRDAEGRTTVRAVRLANPLRVDGSLDEDVYRTITPISDFVQTEPRPGAPATERTDVWISFDDDNIYVAVRASESQPERMIVNEMRRDSSTIFQNENFQFSFDTFFDRRNSVAFQFNPIGGRMDGQVSNEGSYNGDWNPLWRLQVRRNDTGWTAEAAVPFKSLRYKQGAAQIWGFQARRINRWKNEVSFLTPVPNGLGSNAFQRVSSFATMVGLELPTGSRALDLKPYVTSNVATDLTAAPAVRNDIGRDFGVDAKYAVTQNLTADFTYNTDFAQVEVDEQQVNLTRFSLFFPEKRDFFLENQGLFSFASNLGATGNNTGGDTPTLFYTRRIGLDSGRQVPIEAGGRLSGRIGRFSVGLLNIQTDSVDRLSLPSTNYAVGRVRMDVLRRGAIGAIFTQRSVTANGAGPASAYGVDGSFGFFQNLAFNTFWARTDTPGVRDGNVTYRTQMNYNADRYGVNLERLHIGNNFDPQVGFVRRRDFTKSRAMFRFTPRPKNHFKAVRKFGYQTSIEIFHNRAGQMETRERKAEFFTEFQSSDRFEVVAEDAYEFLPQGFDIAANVRVPSGGYDQRYVRGEFQFGQQRPISGTVFGEVGAFYAGERQTFGYSGGRVNVSPQLSVEPGVSVNRVRLPFGDFTATLVSARTTFTVTPLMFVSGLVQYNSSNHTVGANVRLRWEYQPGSELFVVYNEGRDTLLRGSSTLQQRALIFKINRLFRF